MVRVTAGASGAVAGPANGVKTASLRGMIDGGIADGAAVAWGGAATGSIVEVAAGIGAAWD